MAASALGFSRPIYAEGQRLVLLFGIANLKEGVSARALPVNVTVIRQGTGEFYGTQGDDKCTLDEVLQDPVAGIPLRNRMYHVTARGFCIQPARSLRGDGAVLITRFDFSGRIDFSEADTAGRRAGIAADRRHEAARDPQYRRLGLLLSLPLIGWGLVASAASSPDVSGYQVINAYPHDATAFTQGLVYVDGTLYESTGLNGQSSIRRVDLATGTVLQKQSVDPAHFAEGLDGVERQADPAHLAVRHRLHLRPDARCG